MYKYTTSVGTLTKVFRIWSLSLQATTAIDTTSLLASLIFRASITN